jgi:cytochrome c553
MSAQPWRWLAIGTVALISCGSAWGNSMPLPERLAQCAGCHGEDGNSRIEKIPSLAGQPAFFILNQLFLMREGVRKVDAMAPFVKDLTDDELDALSRHYAELPAKASDAGVDAALASRGAELAARLRCGSCHQPDLSGQQQMPRLARQRIDYLVHSLKEFRDGTRTGADTLMSNVVAGLPDADLAALAHYSASR